MPHLHEMTPQMRECIQNCMDCHAICTETAVHCLMMGGEHGAVEHQRRLADCAQACLTAADFMLRSSEYDVQYCIACAEICNSCAEDCERLGGGDQTMQRCAELCRKCEATCRAMSHAHA